MSNQRVERRKTMTEWSICFKQLNRIGYHYKLMHNKPERWRQVKKAEDERMLREWKKQDD